MTEPRGGAPRYRLEACAGGRCRLLVSLANEAGLDDAAWRGEVAAAVRDLAALLRARGVVGHLVVRDVRTGRVVARRQTGPLVGSG